MLLGQKNKMCFILSVHKICISVLWILEGKELGPKKQMVSVEGILWILSFFLNVSWRVSTSVY